MPQSNTLCCPFTLCPCHIKPLQNASGPRNHINRQHININSNERVPTDFVAQHGGKSAQTATSISSTSLSTDQSAKRVLLQQLYV